MGKLTNMAIRNLKTPGRHPDGETLYLAISPAGAKIVGTEAYNQGPAP